MYRKALKKLCGLRNMPLWKYRSTGQMAPILLLFGSEGGSNFTNQGFDSVSGLSTLKAFRVVRVTRVLKIAQLLRIFRFVMALRTLVQSIFHTLKAPRHYLVRSWPRQAAPRRLKPRFNPQDLNLRTGTYAPHLPLQEIQIVV